MRRADSYYAVGVTWVSDAKGGITFESALVRFETLIAAITGGGYYDQPRFSRSLSPVELWLELYGYGHRDLPPWKPPFFGGTYKTVAYTACWSREPDGEAVAR